MKAFFFCIFGIYCFSAIAYPPLPPPRTEEEALFVRRIINFWRAKEYNFAKSHIQAYLQQESESPFADHLYAMLGDIAMHDKAYLEALNLYDKINDLKLKKELRVKRWQALYQIEHYVQLYQEIAPLSPHKTEEEQFYFAEAAFREALTLLHYPEGREQAQSLCREALPFYIAIANSQTFGSHAKLAMAEIYRLLEQPKEAAELYLELAQEENDEEILFHAGAMLTQCNVLHALEIFKKIAQEGGARASEAAFQLLKLLANERKWEQIAHERELLIARLEKTKLPIGYFYLGMIAYEKKQFHQTVADLTKSIEGGLAAPHDKKALLTLMMSAKELEKIDTCEKIFSWFEERYPDDLSEISFLRAIAYHKVGEKSQALTLLQRIIQTFPGEEVVQQASLEKIYLLIATEKLQEAHTDLLLFLESYPSSPKKIELIRLAIELSLKQLAEETVYAQLAEDLERGFAFNLFEGEEKEKKRELLIKAYLKFDHLENALSILQEMDEPDPMLWAHYYIKEGSAHEKIIEYGERALEKQDEDRLHLHLFNAYLALTQNNRDEALTQKAAEHLNAIIDIYPVSLENRLWLAHYLVKQKDPNAIPLLETLLQTETNWRRFDEEALILAKLYQAINKQEKAKSILEKIITLERPTQSKAKLALAHLFQEIGEKDEALALYYKLEESQELSIAYAAQLQLARLKFSAHPQQSLEKLHDLKIRKTLPNEPIHLEAAFDWADFKSTFFSLPQRKQKLLELLFQIKEEFTKQDDIWAKDYHATRELMPEKDLIYQAYMRYLDGWIYLLESELAKNKIESNEKKRAAYTLFSSLRQGKYAVSKYLVEKAIQGMHDY